MMPATGRPEGLADEGAPPGHDRATWRVPERGTVLGIRFVVALCALAGRRAATSFLWVLCVYYAAFDWRARRASKAYLRRVGHADGFFATVDHFWHFARVSLDRYLFLTGRIEDFDVRLHGDERIAHASRGAREGGRARGALLLGAHLGSFEAMRAVATRDGVPINVIVDFRTARRMNGVLAELGPALRVRMIALDPKRATSMLDVKERIDRGELVAILADRTPDRADRVTSAEFLGQTATLPSGPFLLAHMLNCPVYLVFALHYAPNRYDVYCEPFADAIRLPRSGRDEALRTHAQRYADRVAHYARMAPLNWFNFFDFWS